MTKALNTTLIILVIIWSNTATAQKYIDLAKFSYAVTPANNFDTTSSSTTLHELSGDATIPVVINEKVALLTGVAYEMVSSSFNPDRSIESFTGLTLKMGANVKHNKKWSGTYMLLPKLSSDFRSIGSDDFQLGGAVIMKYAKSDNFSYKFGAYGNTELFGPFIVPIFGFYYLNKTEKFEAKVLLPLAVDLNYKVSKSARFGLSFNGQVRSYNVNTPVEMEKDRYMVKSANDLYTYFQYEVKNGFNIQLGVGRSLGRSYRMYDEKVKFGIPLAYFGDHRRQINTDFSDSWLLKLTAFYRLNLDKPKKIKK